MLSNALDPMFMTPRLSPVDTHSFHATLHLLVRSVVICLSQCDGQYIPLPSLQGIAVLNIPSYAGGTNFWGGTKEDDVSTREDPSPGESGPLLSALNLNNIVAAIFTYFFSSALYLWCSLDINSTLILGQTVREKSISK